MVLEYNDYLRIASQIEEGESTVEYEKDGETLCIDYVFEEDGYVEDDSACGGYMTGTGAYVRVYARLTVKEVGAYNGDGEEVPVEFSENTLREISEQIN